MARGDGNGAVRTILTIATHGPGLTEITAPVCAALREGIAGAGGAGRAVAGHAGGDGLLTLFVRHTSCSLLVQENADPDVRADLGEWLGRLVPPADHAANRWMRHRAEGPDDMPAHLKAAVLPVSLAIPVAGGRPMLGTWQGLYLVEHRDAPQRRQVVVHFRPD